MSKMLVRADGLELYFCDLCGNYVPAVEVEGDLLCAYEYAEYPDIANIVGQCQWFVIVLVITRKEN